MNSLPPETLIEAFFHKLSQPIGALYGSMELGMMSDNPEDCRVALQKGMQHVERLLWLFRVTRTFFGTDFQAGARLVSIRESVDGAAKNCFPLADSANVRLSRMHVPDVRVLANPDHLRQAIENVFVSSIRSGGSGELSIAGEVLDRKVIILVGDQSPFSGRSSDSHFEPFPPGVDVSPEKPGNLDLALSRRILRAIGGDLSVGPSPHGTRQFEIVVPSAE